MFLTLSIVYACNKKNHKKEIKSSEFAFISAKAGLNMRQKPKANALKVATVPYRTKVKVMETDKVTVKIGSVSGQWKRINWNNLKGWVFGAYLSKEKIAKLEPSERIFPSTMGGAMAGNKRNYEEAKSFCKRLGKRLPTYKEINAALLKSQQSGGGGTVWTSEETKDGRVRAYSIFIGMHGGGGIEEEDRDKAKPTGVICIKD